MICWTIKRKGKGYLQDNNFGGDEYGKLSNAEFFNTKTEAMESIQEKNEEAVKIEIRELD